MQINQYRAALRLIHHSALANHAIAKMLKISPNTVKKCRRTSESKSWGWEEIQGLDDHELSSCFKAKRILDDDKVIPDWTEVHKFMQMKHQTLIQLWDEYRSEHKAKAYCYSQFTHYYREFISKVDVTMRQTHYAGEIIFVDYAGKTLPYTDIATGEQLKAQVFVGVLGCSNYTFVWASKSQSTPDWIEAHSQMLKFFGGVPEVVVPDNLKAAVVSTGKHSVINKTYQELSEHYGFVIVPARVRKPQDKSKAELGVKFITNWISMPLSRRQFFSVDEINQAIAELLPRFNQRSFKRLPGCRYSRFIELDQPVLKPLPDTAFEYGEWLSEQKVGPDYHVYAKGHAYSVPFRLVGQKVAARMGHKTVELFCLGKRVASHFRDDIQGEATTDPNHRPENHQVYASSNLEHYLEWAIGIGESLVNVIKVQFKDRPNHALIGRKACSQLQQLAKQYGTDRIESACARALFIQSPTVKSIRSILQHGLDETDQNCQAVLTSIPTHQNVRGARYYDEQGD